MTTRREALVKAGLAKPGRGKFSKDANAWLDAQRAAGVKFSDDDAPVRTLAAPKSKVDAVAKVREAAQTSTMPDFFLPDEYRFPEKEFKAIERRDGKRIQHSMRECCNTCRVSLVNHGCDAPTILGNIVVEIVPI